MDGSLNLSGEKNMKCFVCGAEMEPFLEKDFHMETLGTCEYVRCVDCGLVVSRTHYEMDTEAWQKLNYECHSFYQGTDSNDVDPNWISRLKAQSDMLSGLFLEKIVSDRCRCLDYGCGDGKLVDMINGTVGKSIFKKYDEFMGVEKAGYLQKEEIEGSKFDLLVTGSVFEHLIGRPDVDKVFNLLSDDGTFGLHTMVCDEVPNDSQWFYFLPVHCTFYTNESMRRIFVQYGFKGCAYHVESRMWLFFRNAKQYERLASCMNEIPGKWQTSDAFVDYWKSKPYREK